MRICSQDIGMEFGREKRAMLVIENRKRHPNDGIELPNHDIIRKLCEKEPYKHLDILASDNIKKVEMKEKN